MVDPFVRQMRHTIDQYALLPSAGLIVVACSGGADSLALLHALNSLCGRPDAAYPGVRLHVAHIDHGLRDEESAIDAAFVAETAATWDLPCTVGVIMVEERATWQGSIEAAARTSRYRILRAIAADVGADRIALGHTASDQAETVLMHFLRGGGLDGLSGMRYCSGDLIRPLLDQERAMTTAYCARHDLTPCDDSSNTDYAYLRNRVRHELLPLLETYQPRIRQTLNRNAAIIARDADYLNEQVDLVWNLVLNEQTETNVTLSRSGIRTLPEALRWRVFRRAILAVGSNKPDAHLDANSIARLERVVMDRSGERRRVEMSTGIVVEVTRDAIRVEK
jgi:tRNA(Ile)-lysidine synthase